MNLHKLATPYQGRKEEKLAQKSKEASWNFKGRDWRDAPLAYALSMYFYSLVEPIKRAEWRPDNRIPIGNNRAMKQNCHSANLLSSLCVSIYKMEASHVILPFSEVEAVFADLFC